jgi:methyl-accepting chemotaxis protein
MCSEAGAKSRWGDRCAMLAYKGFLAEFEELEQGQKDALAKAAKLFDQHIEATLQEFYAKAVKDPEVSGILAAGPGIHKLIQSQRRHWQDVLSGNISDQFRDHSRHIGVVHAHIGVLPKHYVAGYAYFMEAFIRAALGPKSWQAALTSALVRTILVDMSQALTGYYRALEERTGRAEATALAASIEPEVDYVKRVADEVSTVLNQVTSELTGAISDVETGVQIVEGGSAANSTATQSVAAALTQIQASTTQVGGRAQEMSQLAGEAAEKSRNLGLWLDRLRTASQRISEITKLIDGIAKQTNLLALNATIEAGRAGKAGTGFAVVANEIKQLSQHSAGAAKEIAHNISGIQADLNPAIVIMDEIGALVQQVDTAAKAVTENVSSGIEALGALGSAAGDAAKGAAEQRGAVEHFTTAVSNANQAAESLGKHTTHLGGLFEGLAKRIAISVANIAHIEERVPPSTPVHIPVSFKYAGQSMQAATISVSHASALIAGHGCEPPPGSMIEYSFAGVGAVLAEVLRHQPLGMRIKFIKASPEFAAALEDCMNAVLMDEHRLKIRLCQCRDEIEKAIARGIERGDIAAEAMFDFDYRPIENTYPPQVSTKFLPFLEQILPPLQEPVLKFDPQIVFCAAVDCNGYLPVHNAKYSKPQGQDPVWNTGNCRNRRIFDGQTGLIAARNEQEFISQVYLREMGGGKMDILRDLSVPLTVAGRHWGAVRMGTELPQFAPLFTTARPAGAKSGAVAAAMPAG